eukprot:1527277-Pyramimonas_sp.AAC.1
MPAAWHVKEACVPADVPRRRPKCWQPSTCKCQKHKEPPTPPVFQAFCNMDSKGRSATVLNTPGQHWRDPGSHPSQDPAPAHTPRTMRLPVPVRGRRGHRR